MNNCWISYMLPFPDEVKKSDKITIYKNGNLSGDTQTIAQFQEACIKHKIFGMGWDTPDLQNCDEQRYLNAARAKYDPEEYSKAKKYYFMLKNRVKPGNIVMQRSRNGHYYIGKVMEATGPEYLHTGDNPFYHLSWGYHVEEWYPINNDLAVPGLIRGRFSQRYHPTLQAINDHDLIQVMNMLYEKLAYGKPITEPPKLTVENFAKFFDYRELEDLVYLYILDENKDKGYTLLPSSCKISQPKYEFWIANCCSSNSVRDESSQ